MPSASGAAAATGRATAGPGLRVGVDPIDGASNPYAALLNGALREQGVLVEEARLRPWALNPPPEGPAVVHVHWPEFIMVGTGTGARHAGRAVLAGRFLRHSLRRLQGQGVRLVWTAHNLRPHNPSAPRDQVALYRWMAGRADAVIVHSRYAASQVAAAFGRTGGFYVAPHGNYGGVYPPAAAGRAELRARRGIGEDERVLLAFGEIKRYKRLPELARAFSASAAPDTRLLIAGRARDEAIGRELAALAAADPRIVLEPGRVPDDEVAALYALADVAVLNYDDVFSSGALLLALSLGTAVLAPGRGSAGEVAGEPAVFAWERSPLDALERALAVPAAARRDAALAAAAEHTWERAARCHVRAYRGEEPEAA